MEQHIVTAMYLGTKFGYGLAVNLYNTSLDELIGLTT